VSAELDPQSASDHDRIRDRRLTTELDRAVRGDFHAPDIDARPEQCLSEGAPHPVAGTDEGDVKRAFDRSSSTRDEDNRHDTWPPPADDAHGGYDFENNAIMGATICFVVGARPNFMKVAPVFRALDGQAAAVDRVLLHTGQHYDDQMSEIFIGELGLPAPDIFLGVGSGSHAEQTARVLTGVERVLLDTGPDLVVVAGDVNSTLAAALAAVKLDIPVAHLEAGLRSFDSRMPEEHNRKLTDHVSSLLLAHSPDALDNLHNEGIADTRVHLVGNTMIDSVFACLPSALSAAPWNRFEVEERGYVLVTLHRPSLVDDAELLAQTFAGLQALSAQLPVIFPVHPRTLTRIEGLGIPTDAPGSRLIVTEPLGYLDFLALEARAMLVLTDSGGVQEETSALGVPCFTLRDSTERPITITEGTNTLLGLDPGLIAGLARRVVTPRTTPEIDLWDGHAGPRAAEVLRRFIVDRAIGAGEGALST